jgi:hypothetical protein
MGERRGAYRASVGKPEGRRPLERPKRRWKDVTIEFRQAGWGTQIGSIWLSTETGGGCCEYGDESSGSINCGEFLE